MIKTSSLITGDSNGSDRIIDNLLITIRLIESELMTLTITIRLCTTLKITLRL